jgi:glutamate racemase
MSIGVLDSGVGGLSVLREVRRTLPGEHLLYVADSAHSPYGDRDAAFINARVGAIADFLMARGAKAIVVACNTATGVAVDGLRQRLHVPVVAIEPAVKPAAQVTRTGKIGVLATSRTLDSDRFARLVTTHAAGLDVLEQPCPGLVEQIEAGDFTGPATRALVERYVGPLRDAGVDALVLGCTHFPFVAALIREVAGPGVTIIDPSAAVARELARRLEAAGLTSANHADGRETFLTTGDAAQVAPVLGHVWGQPVDLTHVDI